MAPPPRRHYPAHRPIINPLAHTVTSSRAALMKNSSRITLPLLHSCTRTHATPRPRPRPPLPPTTPKLPLAETETKGFDMAPETNDKVAPPPSPKSPPNSLPAPPTHLELPPTKLQNPHLASPKQNSASSCTLRPPTPSPPTTTSGTRNICMPPTSNGTPITLAPPPFGYKDFIPQFTCEKFNADQWAELFKNPALNTSSLPHSTTTTSPSGTPRRPTNAKNLGPHQTTSLAENLPSPSKQGLKFGLSNHGIEAFQFVNPTPALRAELEEKKADLFDPKWADWYHVADRSDDASQKIPTNWAQPQHRTHRPHTTPTCSGSTTASTCATRTPSNSGSPPTTTTAPPNGTSKSPSPPKKLPTPLRHQL